MSIQQILVYITVIIALLYLARKLFFQKKKTGCNKTGCDC